MKAANLPLILRKTLTDGRLRKASKNQRGEIILTVQKAWKEAAADRFSGELVDMLSSALIDRTDERAVLFLI